MAEDESSASPPDVPHDDQPLANGLADITDQLDNDTLPHPRTQAHQPLTPKQETDDTHNVATVEVDEVGELQERRLSDELIAAARQRPRRKSNLKQPGGAPGLALKQVSFVHKQSSQDLLNVTSRE